MHRDPGHLLDLTPLTCACYANIHRSKLNDNSIFSQQRTH